MGRGAEILQTLQLDEPQTQNNTEVRTKRNYSPPWLPPWPAELPGRRRQLYSSHNMASSTFPCSCLILCSFPIVVVSLKPDNLLNMARNPLNPALNSPLLQLIPGLKPCSLCLQPPGWGPFFGGMPLHEWPARLNHIKIWRISRP